MKIPSSTGRLRCNLWGRQSCGLAVPSQPDGLQVFGSAIGNRQQDCLPVPGLSHSRPKSSQPAKETNFCSTVRLRRNLWGRRSVFAVCRATQPGSPALLFPRADSRDCLPHHSLPKSLLLAKKPVSCSTGTSVRKRILACVGLFPPPDHP